MQSADVSAVASSVLAGVPCRRQLAVDSCSSGALRHGLRRFDFALHGLQSLPFDEASRNRTETRRNGCSIASLT
jgi:hypothetical protein